MDDLARSAGNRWMSAFARTEASALRVLQVVLATRESLGVDRRTELLEAGTSRPIASVVHLARAALLGWIDH